MSADIGPGDWVESLGNAPSPRDPRRHRSKIKGPPKGTLCLVEEVVFHWTGDMGLVIRDWPSDHPLKGSWSVFAFRPIYRPKSEIIEALKAPAPSETVPA